MDKKGSKNAINADLCAISAKIKPISKVMGGKCLRQFLL